MAICLLLCRNFMSQGLDFSLMEYCSFYLYKSHIFTHSAEQLPIILVFSESSANTLL
jgi:hypothetical protein